MTGPDAGFGAEERVAVLRRAARLLSHATELESTMAHTIAACLPALGDFGFFDLVVDDGVRRTARAHEDATIEVLLGGTRWVRSVNTEIDLCALSTGRSALHTQIDDAWYQTVAESDGHLALLRALAFRSMITVPMRYRDELVGALTLFYGRSGRQFTREHQAFAEEVAGLAVPVVINARFAERHARAEAALRASEERLRLALEAGRFGIWDWDVDRSHVAWSDRTHEQFGVPRGQFGGSFEDFISRVHPADHERVREKVQTAIECLTDYEVEFRTVTPGPETWLATRGKVYREGGRTRMLGATWDITDRVELLAAERAARADAEEAKRRFELLARAGECFARSLDRQATLDAIGDLLIPAMGDMCRVDLLDDAGELTIAMLYHPDPAVARQAFELGGRSRLPAEVEGSIAWVAANRRPQLTLVTPEYLSRAPDRELAEFLARQRAALAVPLVARDRTLGVLSVAHFRDREPSKLDEDLPLLVELANRAALALDNARLFAAAEHARREAEAANRAKDEFLAILGHELRNPLAPLVTALRLLDQRAGEAFVRERASIGRQVSHLSRLVDDLLDVSRIVRGNVELDLQLVDLADVVHREIEATAPVFAHHGITLSHELPASPAWVRGDLLRLAQIIGNLLSNALKFSSPGCHTVIRVTEADDTVELSVHDTGIGIAPELIPRLFELFVQGEQPLDRERGGLGLGLAIVANLVERHGGSVAAQSEGVGWGSTFRVRLPRCDTAQLVAPPGPLAGAVRGSGRLLLVDDNHESSALLAEFMRELGYEIELATTAAAALELLDTHGFDAAVLDIGLPGMNGYELARQLRAAPRHLGLVLVAMTGYADRGRALAAGFDEHLVKPVMPETLVATIQRLRAR